MPHALRGPFTQGAAPTFDNPEWLTSLDDYAALYSTSGLNVLDPDYGVAGDGTTDDGAEIVAVITAAGNNGTTIFPNALYRVSPLTTLTFSKLVGLGGSSLRPANDTMTVLTLEAGSGLASGDFQLVRDLTIDGTGKTGITGLDSDVAGATAHASIILENVYIANCDTIAFNLRHTQFVRTYNLRATAGGGVGMYLKNHATQGGANSHDHYGLHLVQKAVGVVVDGTGLLPVGALHFYNPQVLENTVCGMAFFEAHGVHIYGGSPEMNATGAATYSFDGHTIKRSSMYLNYSRVNVKNISIAEASANPVFLLENKSVLTLENCDGYGGGGVLVSCDASSGVHLLGAHQALGVVQNVLSWPDALMPSIYSAQQTLYGQPVHSIDPTVPVLYSELAPNFAARGTTPPTMSFVEDADLDYCRQAVFTANAGGVDANAVEKDLGTGVGSRDSLFTVLLKSSIDTQIAVNLYDGALFHAYAESNIYLKAGKTTKLVLGRRNIPGGAWKLIFYPVSNDAPTIKFAALQVYQGTIDTAATTADVAKIVKHGAFNPGVIRDTQTNLTSLTATVNTTGKYPGKQVWDTTNNRPVFAAGQTAASVWKDGANATVHTPV